MLVEITATVSCLVTTEEKQEGEEEEGERNHEEDDEEDEEEEEACFELVLALFGACLGLVLGLL